MQDWFEPPSTSKLFFDAVKMPWKIFLLYGLCSCAAPHFTRGKRAWKARKKICCVQFTIRKSGNMRNLTSTRRECVCLLLIPGLVHSWMHFWAFDFFPYCQFHWLCLKPGLLPLPPWFSWYIDCTLCPSWTCLWWKVGLVSCARGMLPLL